MMDILSYLIGLIPALITGVAIFYVQRAQKKRDTAVAVRTAVRKEEALLALDLQMATAKLSYATAMAVKRGTPNGEIEDGIEAYEKARSKYYKFLNEQAEKYLM